MRLPSVFYIAVWALPIPFAYLLWQLLHFQPSLPHIWLQSLISINILYQIHTDRRIKGISNYLTKQQSVLLLHVSSTFWRLSPHSSFSFRCCALTESSFISKLLICCLTFSRVVSLTIIKWEVVTVPHSTARRELL